MTATAHEEWIVKNQAPWLYARFQGTREALATARGMASAARREGRTADAYNLARWVRREKAALRRTHREMVTVAADIRDELRETDGD